LIGSLGPDIALANHFLPARAIGLDGRGKLLGTDSSRLYALSGEALPNRIVSQGVPTPVEDMANRKYLRRLIEAYRSMILLHFTFLRRRSAMCARPRGPYQIRLTSMEKQA